ncbi:MAG TPA: SRPBCC family protein [Acidimicrobiia bacterium]|nr:SRPBCC family protein [Acidimicrobiia bacterium]
MTNISNKASAAKGFQLSEQRWIARPQSEVFEYAADFSNIEDWDPGVTSSTKIGDAPVGVGTRYELEVRFGSKTMPMIYETAVYEAPNRVVLHGYGDRLDAVDEIRFSSHDNMTVVDYTAVLYFKNFFRYLGPLMRPALTKVGRDALDGLEQALER